ncbi:ATP-binding cassette domain-containing protein [Mesorhizobium australicum]
MFQALFGASKANGTIELWGKSTSIGTPRQALIGKDGIALVPEDRRGQGLLLTKSVRENLTLSVIKRFTEHGLLSRQKEAALVKEMVDFLHIKAGTSEQLAGTLSGGNQQKVIFGKMLLTQARVLLLYDPTRGVDVGTKGEIFQLMRDLAAKGYAILFHSSDMPELVHVADRVLVMRNGSIAATFTLCGVAVLSILLRENLMHFVESRPRVFDAITRTIEGLAGAALVVLAVHEILLR